MKLNNVTLGILKNFASINPNIWIDQGNILQTMDPSKSIFAKALITDSFPQSFGIYDLNNFLAILSIHKEETDLDFDEHNILIQGLKGRSCVKYRFAQKDVLVVPTKSLKMPSTEIGFSLEENDLVWVLTTAKVLQSPHIAVRSDGERMFLVVFDAKNDAAHQEILEIGSAIGVKYNMIFSADKLNKIVSGSYQVQMSSQGIAYFKHQNSDLEYWVLMESISTYNKD
jgi:hypothetical protein